MVITQYKAKHKISPFPLALPLETPHHLHPSTTLNPRRRPSNLHLPLPRPSPHQKQNDKRNDNNDDDGNDDASDGAALDLLALLLAHFASLPREEVEEVGGGAAGLVVRMWGL